MQLDWALNDDWLLYAGWNRGIKGSGFNAPLFPFSPPLEDAFIPSADRIADAVRTTVRP